MTQKNKIAIWVPAKKQNGLGHYYRNLWILEKNSNASFFFNEDLEIEVSESRIVFINSMPDQIESYLVELGVETLVIDHYFLSQEIYLYFEQAKQLRVVYFDNNFKFPNFSAVLNSNPFALEMNVPNSFVGKSFLGAEYYCFRNEINQHLNTIKNGSVFISFGGSDVNKLSLQILHSLKKNMVYHLFLGKGCTEKYANEVFSQAIKLNLNLKVHYNSPDYFSYLSRAAFAILTSSTSVYECDFLKTPFVAIEVAENQSRLSQYLKSRDVVVLNDISQVENILPTQFKLLNLEYGKYANVFLSYLES